MLSVRLFRYLWGQDLNEITVEIPLDFLHQPNPIKAKDLALDISASHLSIRFLGEALFEGDWFLPVIPGDSTWSLEDGERLVISADKGMGKARTWWKSAFIGDPEIDVTKVCLGNGLIKHPDYSSKMIFEIDCVV